MLGVYSVAQVRAAERVLLDATPAGALMQRAASGLAAECAALLTEAVGRVAGARVVVLVGSGNNGGDALFAAARLAGRGASVLAITLSDAPHPAGLAALLAAGGTAAPAGPAASPDQALIESTAAADLVLDGIVGIGGEGPLRAPAGAYARAARSAGLSVAVDLPSGISPDTGLVADPDLCFHADVTVTFGALKPGAVVDPAATLCGIVELVDIGLGPMLAEQVPEPDLRMIRMADAGAELHWPGPGDNKYSRGVVGISAASQRYPGAAVMACSSARYGGAGMVHYAGAASADVIRACPEVISSPEWPQDARISAWGIGPGWSGSEPGEATMAGAAVANARPLVADAGALTLLASSAELREAVRSRTSPTVVTPHDGEFARLGGPDPSAAGRVAAARALARELGVVVLLKGAGTIVAPPSGPAYVARVAPPELATAGSGDVLTGLLSSMMAAAEAHSDSAAGAPAGPGVTRARAGIDDAAAARVAVAAAYLHGLAGRLAVDVQGVISAGDLIDALPAALTTAHEIALEQPRIQESQ